MIVMATDRSFSQNIIARYTGFSDRLSAEAELLYLRKQEGLPAETVEEIYETNIRNITNISQYFSENQGLPLRIDLGFVGKLVSDAVKKIAGARMSRAEAAQRPAVLKTEGRTAAVSGEATKPLSESPHPAGESLLNAREDGRPQPAAQTAKETKAAPPVSYAPGDLLHRQGPNPEETAQRGEKAENPAAGKKRDPSDRLQAEEFRMERERLMLKETELEHAASDLKQREAGLREERRAFEHGREASRPEPMEHHTENKQEFHPGKPGEEFPDRIDRPGHGAPSPERHAEAGEAPSAAPAKAAPPEPLDFTYENLAGAPAQGPVSRDRAAGTRRGPEPHIGEEESELSPASVAARRQAAPAAPEEFVYPEAAAAADVGVTPGRTPERGPISGNAARRAVSAARPEDLIYPEAAISGRGENAARREPEQGFRGEGGEAETRSEADLRGSAEHGSTGENAAARRQAAPAQPANLVLPENKTPEPQSGEPAALPKIRFPERAARESVRRPEPRETLPRGEPETIVKARMLERETETAAPVIVARRAGEEFTPAGIVYGRPAREEMENPPRNSTERPLPEGGRIRNPAPEQKVETPRALSGRDGQAGSTEKDAGTPRGPGEALHRPAPFEPIRLEHGAPEEEARARPAGEGPVLSEQKTPDSIRGRDFRSAPEAENEAIKASPPAIRRAEIPQPAETVLPMSAPVTGLERQRPRGSFAAQSPENGAPGQTPAGDFPRRIAAKFHPASMEQRFRPVSAAREALGLPATEGRMRPAPASMQNPIPGGRVPPGTTEPAFDAEGNPRPAGGRMRKPVSSGASDLVLGGHGASGGDVEGRMAAAGIETRTRQRRRVVSQTEELHEHTVNRAINAPAAGAARQTSRAAVEEELMSSTNIRKIADKVYQELESRLRSEKIRRGKL